MKAVDHGLSFLLALKQKMLLLCLPMLKRERGNFISVCSYGVLHVGISLIRHDIFVFKLQNNGFTAFVKFVSIKIGDRHRACNELKNDCKTVQEDKMLLAQLVFIFVLCETYRKNCITPQKVQKPLWKETKTD